MLSINYVYYGEISGKCDKLVDLDKIVTVVDVNDKYIASSEHPHSNPPFI